MSCVDERPAKRLRLEVEKVYSRIPDYGSGLHLAPMVRCGSLPTRLLCLKYGANLVWGPEIVDRALIDCEQSVDPITGVVRFQKKGKTIWDTHPIEKDKVIYQIGSASPELAAQAAKMVESHVAGIDLNCGCPKPFSTSGHFGAALLTVPDTLCSILRALVEAVNVPVSCKIRLLPSQEDTIDLIKQICGTGISCLTIHCRTREMRPREAALLHRLRELVDVVKPFGIPVVANGDCLGYYDIERIKEMTGVSSIMIARAAEANMSAFRPEGLLDPLTNVIPLYLQIAQATDNSFPNSKYCINSMDLSKTPLKEPGVGKKRKAAKQDVAQSKTYEQLAKVTGASFLPEADLARWTQMLLPELHDDASSDSRDLHETDATLR